MKCLTSLLHTLKKLIKSLILRIGLRSTIRDDATSALRINGLEKKEDIIIQHTETKSDTITGADSQATKKELDMLKVFQSEVIKKAPEQKPIDTNVMCKCIGFFQTSSISPSYQCVITLCNNVDLILTDTEVSQVKKIPKEANIYQCLLYPNNTDDSKENYIIVEMFNSQYVDFINDLEAYGITLGNYNNMYRSLSNYGCSQ